MTGVAADSAGSALRAGTLTFLVSGFEDAMRLRDAAPDAMAQAVGVHREIVAEATARGGGGGLAAEGEGSAAVATFRSPLDALRAALEVRRAVRSREWPDELALRVRIA